ncbi:hypothetical protein [Brevundimonas alba]|uniref:hypothetical protein n=1 Tax=Brevundimonas alba TaxID=74314 RepID=UPI0031591ED6
MAEPRARIEGSRGKAVLGYATGYGPADLEPFVRSLRAHFDGVVALTVDDRPDVAEFLARFDIMAEAPLVSDAWTPHPVVERFAAYDRWISRRRDVTEVLLTDVRDVVFQGDPFARPLTRLEAYTEGRGGIGAHAFNVKHLKALAGASMTSSLADRPSLCAGTICGPAVEVSRLCRTLLMLAAIPRSQVGGGFGADQAAFNLAVHMGLIEADVRPNFERVATIGDASTEPMHVRDDDLIVNPDGSISPVVHQYDRHQYLSDAVGRLWGRPDHSVAKGRRKTLTDRRKRLVTSFNRRLPELR